MVKRLSGIELLRIVGMLLILLGHTHLRIKQIPGNEEIADNAISSYLDILLRSITILGVDIFIAISGWFGIKFCKRGLFKYIYMLLFTLFGIYCFCVLSNLVPLNFDGIKSSMGFYEGYWFVLGYLGLYIISPILNFFVENVDKRMFQIVLVSCYLFQCYCSWLSGWYNYYDGYSIFLFGVIYLTSAYFRKYPIEWIYRKALLSLIITILIISFIAFSSLYLWNNAGRQIRDDNPLVILSSILLVILFSKWHFYNSFINWLATSCFVVYLIHYSPFVYPYIYRIIKHIYIQYDGIVYAIVLLVSLLIIYTCCTLIDQIRIYSWRLFQKVFCNK